MPIYSRYNKQDDVIETDVTGVRGDRRELIDTIFDEIIAIAKTLPGKPWVVACWKNVVFADPAIAEYYGQRTSNLLNHVAGVVRYAANDPLTRTFVRSQAIKHRTGGTRALLFESRAEAMVALNELRGVRT